MTDTIAAISTPYGKGGIAVIRISGDEAIEIAGKVFRPASKKPLSYIEGGRIVYGTIHAPAPDQTFGKTIDDGMAAIMRAPRSYTGEDTVEISCHGGILLTEQVLSAIIAAGARPAEAGEFTKRAFVAGKLSLTEAEAVINLIDARSEEALKLARSHTEGRLTAKLDEFYESLKTLISTAYVYADYPDEDLTDLSVDEMKNALEKLSAEMQALSDTYYVGHAISEGIATVIVGRPNTGKSSLLNRLLGRERAIVSNIAGTTRDTIEETVQVGKVTLRLTDTAGLRDSDDPIEQIGVERSYAALKEAELILAVFDGTAPLSEEDRDLLSKLKDAPVPKIALLNKSDLASGIVSATDLGDTFHAICPISAETGEGIDQLKSTIESLFAKGEIDYNTTAILANARQKGALDRAIQGVRAALDALEGGFTPDVAGMDLEEAMAALSEADGRAVSADIVDAIFHRFCVGK
ncbi:MAG: tRNA uridine-5-carboxymethylaminomethyl(34) synthesis GTPase MnmE [Clostridia bacterium]|nr:tRNA uridine-5-carboxymethylaminomethyl(34) synthesis GTPase MnmE [Clostridia bacterium]